MKHDVELVEAREETVESLESAEESLDRVAAAIKHAVVFPRLQAVALGRHDGNPRPRWSRHLPDRIGR